jgi:acyl-CoA thioester hydrolase
LFLKANPPDWDESAREIARRFARATTFNQSAPRYGNLASQPQAFFCGDAVMQWRYNNPFTMTVTVSELDMDALGHTNNAVYVTWCEQCAWAHSNALGMDIATYRALDRAMVIRRSRYDYQRATAKGDHLIVGTWIVEWDGKTGMRRQFEIYRESDAVLILHGEMEFLCVEMTSGKIRRMPEKFIRSYGAAVLPHTAEVNPPLSNG